jgi:transcription elongation factor GreA
MPQVYVSKEKLEELQTRLQELKTTRRFEIAERLKKAKEYGDLSENFEYAHVKEEQEKLEREIFELEQLTKNARIITKSRSKETVTVGSTVTVKSSATGKITLTIVGSEETDPSQNKISNVSPIGKALLGHRAGEMAGVITPKGKKVEYTILNIE